MTPGARGLPAEDLVQGSVGDSEDPTEEGGLDTSLATGSAVVAAEPRSPRIEFVDLSRFSFERTFLRSEFTVNS